VGKKKKLQRFAENDTFEHLFQYNYEQLQKTGFPLKGKWREQFFNNNNPIVLELGCGKGEYTIGLAKARTASNHIGMDIKGARMWRGLRDTIESKLTNVAFIRSKIELVEFFFGPDEVDEIWITFPDPQPQQSRIRKRLSSPRFLDNYRKFLKPAGVVHLKTDSDLLYQYTCEVIAAQNLPVYYNTSDLYAEKEALEVKQIQTFYEKIWLEQGLKIKYLRFGLHPQK
jgi:tRNA (guanine-N7-)-methyltransferase